MLPRLRGWRVGPAQLVRNIRHATHIGRAHRTFARGRRFGASLLIRDLGAAVNLNGYASTTAVSRRRRGVDWTVLVKLVGLVPSLLVGLMILVLAGSMIVGAIPQVPAWAGWVPFGLATVWFLLGFLWFAPFVQGFLARWFFQFREPVNAEQLHLDRSWHEVLRRAGLSGRGRYRLWVEDTDALNASAAGGNIVAVTRGALRYHGDHLGAVLAHELGHHLNGHTYPGLLAWWYSRPLAVVRYAVRVVLRVGLGIVRFISYLNVLVALFAYIFIGGTYLMVAFGVIRLILWAWEQSWVAMVVLALAVILGPVMNRQAEFRADRMAVSLGYGPALVEVFREWQSFGFDDQGGRRGLRALYLASHPPLHARIRRIEKQLPLRA